MQYTMTQVCEETGLKYETLKFYCNEGLIPNLRRDERNRRVFTERNLEWVRSLICLKNCGMSVAEMKRYVELCRQGQETIPERKAILETKLQSLEQEIACIQKNIDFIEYKQQLYQDILDGKTPYNSLLIDEETDGDHNLEDATI